MSSVLSVSQLNTYIKSIIDNDDKLTRVFVVGEISNFSAHYKSGHMYMSLKDEKSLVKAVMFSFSAKRLKFKPSDGMKVIVRGKISVYEATGQYQLYIEDMQPDGLGALNLAYEQLWEKLKKEGLFEKSTKKELPKYPQTVAVITSPTGAAVRDIFSILGRRWPLCEVVLYPCTVQGENAPKELIDAMKTADESGCDVIIIGRGGGSLEDLWAFNDENLARVLYKSKTPVISAVGHENDFTICDFVADVRASTPSAAAEIAVPLISEEKEKVMFLSKRLDYFMHTKLSNCSIKLDNCSNLDNRFSMMLSKKVDKYQFISKSFENNFNNKFQQSKMELSKQAMILDSLSPLKVLSRGYSILTKEGVNVSSINRLNAGDELVAILSDGQAKVSVVSVEDNVN